MILKIKRIISGRTYNTETSTQLAKWSSHDGSLHLRGDPEVCSALFQTRYGAYFAVERNEGLESFEEEYETLTPLDPDQALRWAEKYCQVDDIEKLFGEQPEAGEAEAKITIRMPEALRMRTARAAEERNQSLNTWMVRCLEACIRFGFDTSDENKFRR